MSIHSETQVVDFRGELPEKKENASVFSESFPYISKLGSSLGNLRYFDRSDNTIDYRIFVEGFPVLGRTAEDRSVWKLAVKRTVRCK